MKAFRETEPNHNSASNQLTWTYDRSFTEYLPADHRIFRDRGFLFGDGICEAILTMAEQSLCNCIDRMRRAVNRYR